MSDNSKILESLVRRARQERDELRLQVHLAELEGRDEFERLSAHVDQLAAQYELAQKAVSESVGNVAAAMTLAAEEMIAGFRRVRDAINDSQTS